LFAAPTTTGAPSQFTGAAARMGYFGTGAAAVVIGTVFALVL